MAQGKTREQTAWSRLVHSLWGQMGRESRTIPWSRSSTPQHDSARLSTHSHGICSAVGTITISNEDKRPSKVDAPAFRRQTSGRLTRYIQGGWRPCRRWGTRIRASLVNVLSFPQNDRGDWLPSLSEAKKRHRFQSPAKAPCLIFIWPDFISFS